MSERYKAVRLRAPKPYQADAVEIFGVGIFSLSDPVKMAEEVAAAVCTARDIEIHNAIRGVGLAGCVIAPMNTLAGRGVALMRGENEEVSEYRNPDSPTAHVDALLEVVRYLP